MKTQRHLLISVSTWAFGMTALAGCNDPFPIDPSSQSLEDCPSSEEWILDGTGAYVPTPPLEMFWVTASSHSAFSNAFRVEISDSSEISRMLAFSSLR